MSAPDRPEEKQEAGGDALSRLVEECLLSIESEGSRALERLCAAHPEQAASLRRRIEALVRAGLLEPEGSADARIPEKLGEFRLEERLGSGGMGVVYRARQSDPARTVALKLIRPELLFFPGARERFRREVEAVARLDHPGIVRIYAVGEEKGVPFFAMEYVEGATLAALLRLLKNRDPQALNGRALFEALWRVLGGNAGAEPAAPELFMGSWAQTCCRIALQVAEALAHAHERGVLHRDIKPSNIMLTKDGRALLLDFGLASAEGAHSLTRAGAQLGSLPYMAPEQVLGDHSQIDVRTDVYGLGVTLFELLALEPPFCDSSSEGLRRRILAGDARPLRAMHRGLPRDAETICRKAMDPDRARRYASAQEFGQDLRNFLELRPILARRPSVLYRLQRRIQRRPAAAALVGVLIAVGIGAPLLFGWQQAEARARIAREAERARRNFEAACDLVDSLMERFGERRLATVPGIARLRRDLLERAIEMIDSNPGPAAIPSSPGAATGCGCAPRGCANRRVTWTRPNTNSPRSPAGSRSSVNACRGDASSRRTSRRL